MVGLSVILTGKCSIYSIKCIVFCMGYHNCPGYPSSIFESFYETGWCYS